MEQFWLLRIDYPLFHQKEFDMSVVSLANTQYDLWAKDSDAPGVTHCVSAVRYIVKKATWWHLPYYYVGDMCRRILDNPQIHSSIVPLWEWDIWDMIFFRKKSITHRAYMITHIGILIDEDHFFHSSWWQWWKIDSIESRIKKGNIATCKLLTRFTDPRGGNTWTKKNFP